MANSNNPLGGQGGKFNYLDIEVDASYNIKHLTWFDQYNKFADAMSIPQGNILEPGTVYNAMDLARKLILEEGNELFTAHTALTNGAYSLETLVELADACADLIYVVCQMARAADIPLNAIFAAVHKNNMSKLGPDGKPVRREDGKILKPAGYVPVTDELWKIIMRHHEERCIQHSSMGAENWKSPLKL